MTEIKRLSDEDIEKWVSVNGYEGEYIVSNLGRIMSIKRGEPVVLKPYFDNAGYGMVNLRINGLSKTFQVHRIVANSFFGIQDKMVVDHIDENPRNNCLSNLDVVTNRENLNRYFMKRNGTGLRGVVFDKQRGKYETRISGENIKSKFLIRSFDKFFCGSIYEDALESIISGNFFEFLSDVSEYANSEYYNKQETAFCMSNDHSHHSENWDMAWLEGVE